MYCVFLGERKCVPIREVSSFQPSYNNNYMNSRYLDVYYIELTDMSSGRYSCLDLMTSAIISMSCVYYSVRGEGE